MGLAKPAVPLAIGYFMNDKALETIGAYQLGVSIASRLGAQGATGVGGAY